MAVSLATASDYLQRTTGLLPASGDSTVCFWAKLNPVPVNSTNYIIMDAPGTYVDYMAVYAGTTNIDFEGGPNDVTTTAPTANVWYHVAWVQSGTTQRCYINASLKGSFTYNRAAFTVGDEFLGSDTFDVDGGKAFAYIREWTAALSQAQIQAEMGSSSAVLATNLYMDCPLVSDLLDDSGNGHNWTGVGSRTFVSGPTLPANASAATAIALGVPPQALTLDFGQGTEAWYSYTPSSDTEVVVGFWAFYDYAKVDDLVLSLWSGTPSALTEWPNATNQILNSSSVPFQIPVTFGTTVYFQLKAAFASVLPFTTTIAISTLPGPTSTVPIGAIAVNDDLNGFPLALMGATTGTPLQFVDLAAGGSGVIMTDGLILLDDTAGTQYVCYLNTANGYVHQWSLPYLHGSLAENTRVSSTDGSTLFYIVTNNVSGAAKVDTVDRTGTVVQTFTLANGIRAAAPTQDNTILYYVSAGTNKAIKRWDLVNDMALSDLIAGVSGYQNSVDIVVLADGTVINGYTKASPSDNLIKQISAAGAVLNTYTGFLASGVTTTSIDHLASAIDDPVSVWAWFHNDTNAPYASTFYQITVATGAKVEVVAQQFEQGQYGGDFASAPNARFGHSNSCPFWINRVAIAPPTPVPGESATEYLIRRERWFPHLSHEQFRQFFSMIQVDLMTGNGITVGQGEDPLMELDWSDDGGYTWSSLRFIKTGKIGAYTQRAIAWRLGYSRDRVFRIAVSDPVAWVVVNAYLQVVLGNS